MWWKCDRARSQNCTPQPQTWTKSLSFQSKARLTPLCSSIARHPRLWIMWIQSSKLIMHKNKMTLWNYIKIKTHTHTYMYSTFSSSENVVCWPLAPQQPRGAWPWGGSRRTWGFVVGLGWWCVNRHGCFVMLIIG